MKRRKSKARGGRLQPYNTSMKWQMKGIGLKNTDNSKPAISVVYATWSLEREWDVKSMPRLSLLWKVTFCSHHDSVIEWNQNNI